VSGARRGDRGEDPIGLVGKIPRGALVPNDFSLPWGGGRLREGGGGVLRVIPSLRIKLEIRANCQEQKISKDSPNTGIEQKRGYGEDLRLLTRKIMTLKANGKKKRSR